MRKSLLTRHLFAFIFLITATNLFAQYNVPSNFSTINAAIAAAPAGSTVNIAAGTYNEHVVVNKRITLKGAGNTTIIKPLTTGPAISVTDGGTNWYYRLSIKSLMVTNVTGSAAGGIADATGIVVSGPLANGYITFDHVTSTLNAGHGMLIDNTPIMYDVYLQDCDFTFNQNAGFVIGQNCFGMSGLKIYGGHFDKNGTVSIVEGNGMEIFAANVPKSSDRFIDDVVIKGTTFNHNSNKGIYAERLNDATIENVTVSNNGLTSTFFPNGIDINLKYNNFTDLMIKNAIVTDNGPTLGTGIYVKARNDAPSYSGNPASLTRVSIKGGEMSGSKFGIVFKYKIYCPSVHCAKIYDNLSAGLVNEIDGLPIIDAQSNWWGSYRGPYNAITNRDGRGDTVSNRVDYTPYAYSSNFSSCGGCYYDNNDDDDCYDHNQNCNNAYNNKCTNNKHDHKYQYKCNDDWFSCGYYCTNNAAELAAGTAAADDDEAASSISPFASAAFVPSEFKVSNFPNPFRKETSIQYALPFDSRVSLKIYDVKGSLVTTLVDENKKAGVYTITFNAPPYFSGAYYYKVVAVSKEKEFTKTGNMIRVK